MPISEREAAELADMLPDELECGNSRERLLCLVEILRTLTDREHVLSNADIRAVLRAHFGSTCAPAENSIGADIRALRDSGCLGLSVHITPSGSWCESAALGPAKVRMLLNAVQSSRFLTSTQSAELQESLFGLVSRHQEEQLEGEVLVNQRVRRSYQAVFETCDVITQALRQGRKVEFAYTYNDFRGRPRVLEGDGGHRVRVETPIALLFSEGNYYLESYASVPWRHGSHVSRSRVDRMYDARVSNEEADHNAAVKQAKRSAKRRLRESFDMVGGASRIVFLRVRADYTNVMLDHFGYRLQYDCFEGQLGDVNATALTCVRVAQSFAFYRWLSSAGDGIVMERAPRVDSLKTRAWAKLLDGVTQEQLVGDYEAMVRGYLDFLDRARAPYEHLD